ncbi:RNA polymerase sigma-70 factor [Lunatibacter salilacus]|uniref:RNA polymerase sigma-70 factor n=1 Tax=Lunatibacter salilacus TaxID=2483804 RepID=UPI001F24B3E4|nr:RNA polymerase sigma-70 factor [Lunatibacter salilacus]
MSTLSPNSDQDLLISLRQGDIKAFDELYHRYAKKLMAFALKFFTNKEIAEEAVQEIFIRIWERRRELDENKSFKSYLFQAVKFYMFNYIRDRKKCCCYEEVSEAAFLRENSVEEQIHYEELEATAKLFIEKLPMVQQQVFRLNKFDGLTPQEIAERMNLSKRTIEHHIYLATKTVKSELMNHISISAMIYVGVFF